jgi:hypothetical protein
MNPRAGPSLTIGRGLVHSDRNLAENLQTAKKEAAQRGTRGPFSKV